MVSDRGAVQVVDRAAALLRLLAQAGQGGAILSDLALAAGLTTATCHRILASLVENGMAAREPKGRRYRLGFDFFVLGHHAAEGVGLRAMCRPVLTRLCAETGDTAFLMVRSGFQSVCVDRREGTTMIQTLTGGIGGAVPLGIGPGSQAILAFLQAEEIAVVLQHNAPAFAGFQNHSFKAVEAALTDTVRRGYAHDLGGAVPGISGVAVPIRAPAQGGAIASLGLGMLSTRLDHVRLPRLVSQLQAEAAGLEGRINPLSPWFGPEVAGEALAHWQSR